MDLLGSVDTGLGNLIEDVERRHHARRLSRLGWSLRSER